MRMPTKTNGRQTKHAELTRTLQDLAATLRPGDRFPSQTELMRRFQVSDRTVLRSLEDLRRAGWIVRHHGVGTFVADPQEGRLAVVSGPVATENRVIAAVAPTFGTFYHHCIDLLSLQMDAIGWSLVCHHLLYENSDTDQLPVEALQPRGIVVFSYHLEPIARRLWERGYRTVIVGVPPADVSPEVPCVYSDHEYGGHTATRHLLDLGHRRIAFAFTTCRYPVQQTLRWRGHQRALQEARQAGWNVSDTLLEADILDAWRSDPSLAAAYFQRSDAPTGVVAWNDTEAMTLLRILYSASLRVPEDVSIIGYDALPLSEESAPPLTTVDQHVDRQLYIVMDLLSRPTTPPATQSVVVLPTLMSRASCARPRSG
jgi:DNA-binding LacI/PurR family transcriptional regulator